MTIGRFLAGIGALIWDGPTDKYLLLRRSAAKDFAAGAWECVTGRVDQGEGFEDALHREVYEELSATIEPLFMLGTTHFYRGEPKPENELVGVVYCCRLQNAELLRISSEHDECRWVTAEQARIMLAEPNRTEQWLLQVIERAEAAKHLFPGELIDLHRQQGFEFSA